MITLPEPALFPTKGAETVPPIVGCNSTIDELPSVADWLRDGDRDLELGDAANWKNLDSSTWKSRAGDVRRHLGAYTGRIGVHGPFWGMLLNCPDPEIQRAVGNRLLQGAQFAAEIGATHMVMHSPFKVNGNGHMQMSSETDLANNIAYIQATLEPVVKFAESAGIMLVLENIDDQHPGAQLATVQSFNSKAVRLSIDVGHAQLQARRGGMPPSQWILATAPYLEHLHLQDNDGMADRHWAPGDGELNWYSVFEALATLDHAPRLILEMKYRHNVERGHRYLMERGLAR